jgi:hypothetical protein
LPVGGGVQYLIYLFTNFFSHLLRNVRNIVRYELSTLWKVFSVVKYLKTEIVMKGTSKSQWTLNTFPINVSFRLSQIAYFY